MLRSPFGAWNLLILGLHANIWHAARCRWNLDIPVYICGQDHPVISWGLGETLSHRQQLIKMMVIRASCSFYLFQSLLQMLAGLISALTLQTMIRLLDMHHGNVIAWHAVTFKHFQADLSRSPLQQNSDDCIDAPNKASMRLKKMIRADDQMHAKSLMFFQLLQTWIASQKDNQKRSSQSRLQGDLPCMYKTNAI